MAIISHSLQDQSNSNPRGQKNYLHFDESKFSHGVWNPVAHITFVFENLFKEREFLNGLVFKVQFSMSMMWVKIALASKTTSRGPKNKLPVGF